MNRDDERLLARVISGSATAEERGELARRAGRDRQLAAAAALWAGAWDGLELAPPAAPPIGFAARVAARARAERTAPPLGAALGTALGLRAHPVLARIAAILIVGLGVAMGAGVAAFAPAAEEDSTGEAWTVESLADTYFEAASTIDDAGEVEP